MNSSERRKVLGAAGEALAGEYLVTQGWSILARNWRCREGEIDIVALDPARDCLVVVEVKTRAGTGFGAPLETITYAKVRRLRQLAALYARQHLDEKGRWIDLMTEASILPVNKRPRIAIRIHTSN